SDPNVIYVGSGEGLARPDLSVGDGVYKSTDAGKTWTHLGLRDAQQIPMIIVDPRDANRLYVAALGHPYGPSAERGIYRSTDAGENWTRITTDNRPAGRIGGGDLPVPYVNPKNPDMVIMASTVSWKSVDGGKTWTAFRGAPGGDDYQRPWINPNNPDI